MVATKITQYFLMTCMSLAVAACGPGNSLSAIDESGNESASVVTPNPQTPSSQLPDTGNTGASEAPVYSQKMVLNQAMTVRFEAAGVLENKAEIPAGAEIEVPNDYSTKNLDYRDSNGSLVRSSTGFIYPIKVVSVPSQFQAQFPPTKIDQLNKVSGGLFIFASVVGNIQGVSGNFAVLTAASPGAGFLKNYSASGKPKFSYTKSATKRFSARINKGVSVQSLSAADSQKWQKIYAELKKTVDRTVATPKSYLMIDSAIAKKWSLDYEKTGVIATNGAWSIAVTQTAVRHGFSNVPCAEFQSEILREAYQRAGYRVSDDFNSANGNQLIWSNTAAVVNFSNALYKAGWIPWDSTVYKPMTGAILMNGSGVSPGHTYIAASNDGLFIVDNGAPQGRDLRKTSQSIIEMMYQTGVFFLPPGINPPVW
ncbi:hypothetical protein [Bdellovibrio svalbardensis]|uniref:Peptidase C39-like domain-containing protein n=1 Tax=Bdellovibrio svalbardensis TaxID=2972972 RepID=A0ABT6DK83_9BACT|nr:hypothetical protein [Bdellovibrio svalbardensis]MDG0817286.1 hypothetical protein [Bdellovibrio svalbardensis]